MFTVGATVFSKHLTMEVTGLKGYSVAVGLSPLLLYCCWNDVVL